MRLPNIKHFTSYNCPKTSRTQLELDFALMPTVWNASASKWSSFNLHCLWFVLQGQRLQSASWIEFTHWIFSKIGLYTENFLVAFKQSNFIPSHRWLQSPRSNSSGKLLPDTNFSMRESFLHVNWSYYEKTWVQVLLFIPTKPEIRALWLQYFQGDLR